MYSMNEWMDVDDDEYIETVIGGDFNCVMNNELDRLNCRDGIDIGQIDLKYFMNTFELEDIWRRRNPNRKEYSWMGRGKKSRIDYWIISSSLDNQVDKVRYETAPFSDHSIVYLQLRTAETLHNKGLWKMNVSIIQTKLFQAAFKKMWEQWKQKKQCFQNVRQWWDIGKKQIKELVIWCSKTIHAIQRRETEVLENRLQYLSDNNIKSQEKMDIDTKLVEIYKKKRGRCKNSIKNKMVGRG